MERNAPDGAKRRIRLNKDEVLMLDMFFNDNPNPKRQQIRTLAEEVNVPRKFMTRWFQNKRTRSKNKDPDTLDKDDTNSIDVLSSVNSSNDNLRSTAKLSQIHSNIDNSSISHTESLFEQKQETPPCNYTKDGNKEANLTSYLDHNLDPEHVKIIEELGFIIDMCSESTSNNQ